MRYAGRVIGPLVVVGLLLGTAPAWAGGGGQYESIDPVKVLREYQIGVPAEGAGGQEVGERAGEVAPPAGPVPSYPCEGTVNCHRRLNVRTGPWGRIIDGYPPGTRVQIVAREGDWYRIKRGDGFAYVHVTLVDAPGAPAEDGPNPSPYGGAEPGGTPADDGTDGGGGKTAGGATTGQTQPVPPGKTGGINGPQIPAQLLKGLAAAKQSKWFTTPNKCLQFAGTVAAEAGAKPTKAQAIYPHLAYKQNNALRGSQINKLDDAALAGQLKPGMLIHVKIHYDKDPAYNPVHDAHHWFVYMGLNEKGVPMFADTLRKGNLRTADDVHKSMLGGNASKYGDSEYGYVRRVHAVFDPFADQR